jgi:hypothetical protein
MVFNRWRQSQKRRGLGKRGIDARTALCADDGMGMTFPKWIEAWNRDTTEGNPVRDLTKALEIAWEALELASREHSAGFGCAGQWIQVKDAMRRISELGK